MSGQAGILPKLFSDWGITVAKGQIDNSYFLNYAYFDIYRSPNNYETSSISKL